MVGGECEYRCEDDIKAVRHRCVKSEAFMSSAG